ncbi:MAG: phosphoribosylanthranilate isomerase [Gemmatimonadota bacterium]|nr:phosphoribosylanthranilate isomerase [Gemmatimonadota bacterium]
MLNIKFCGLMRPEDARAAATCGARYSGVILTESPRRIDPQAAALLFEGVPDSVHRVGVFGNEDPDDIARMAREAGLDLVQLHGDPTPAQVRRLKVDSGLRVWAAVRLDRTQLPPLFEELSAVADGIVLDALVPGMLGGTGRKLDWYALANVLQGRRGRASIVLAGGLTPGNVREAIEAVRPDVVDVSSGVEISPGVKDHELMRAFADAALSA